MYNFFLRLEYLFYSIKSLKKWMQYQGKIQFDDIDKVENELLSKLKIDNDYNSLLLLKEIYLKKNDLNKFKNIYGKIIEHKYSFSNSIKNGYLIEYINLLFSNKAYKEIIEILKNQKITNNYTLLYFLIDSYYYSDLKNKHECIIETGKKIEQLSKSKKDYKLFEKIGYSYDVLNDINNAKKYYKKALKINSHSGVKANLNSLNK